MERTANAGGRGALDIAMIRLMQNARLKESEVSALAWGDVESVRGESRPRV